MEYCELCAACGGIRLGKRADRAKEKQERLRRISDENSCL